MPGLKYSLEEKKGDIKQKKPIELTLDFGNQLELEFEFEHTGTKQFGNNFPVCCILYAPNCFVELRRFELRSRQSTKKLSTCLVFDQIFEFGSGSKTDRPAP